MQQLKAELEYSFSIHFLSFSLFSSVAGMGSLVGGAGGRERSGHLQGLAPVFGGGSELDSWERSGLFGAENDPIFGKSSPIMPRSLQHCLERNRQWMFSAI